MFTSKWKENKNGERGRKMFGSILLGALMQLLLKEQFLLVLTCKMGISKQTNKIGTQKKVIEIDDLT